MDPQHTCCPNLDCPARGQRGKGNIVSHGRQRPRSHCRVCGKTFSARHGTPFHRCRTPETLVTQVITLVAHGCPPVAIAAAFGLHTRTVSAWLRASGQHAQSIQAALVEQPHDLQHVQADEIRVKTQAGVVGMAMAVMVSTRLWLGGTVSTQRAFSLIQRLAQLIGRCAQHGALPLSSDPLAGYPTAFARALRTPERTGQRGAPRLVVWVELTVVQLVKAGRGTVGMVSRLVRGTGAAVVRGLRRQQAVRSSAQRISNGSTACSARDWRAWRVGRAAWPASKPRWSRECIWWEGSTTSVPSIAVSH